MAVGLTEPAAVVPVEGIRLAATCSGMRYQNRDDLVLIELSEQTNLAAVFTQNKFRAAPVELAIENLSKAKPRYLIINAGNANAGTGKPGYERANKVCVDLADIIGINHDQVLPFSTGVIGELLDADKVTSKIPELLEDLSSDHWIEAAHAIMTTDTVAKAYSQSINLNSQTISITGIAKGAGMIQPNMATMLSYIATDLVIDQGKLHELLSDAADNTFNSITVDSDTSTNDACVLMATGHSGVDYESLADEDKIKFVNMLRAVMEKLAQSIIRDGEGATKYITINIFEALNDQQAKRVAFSVANSPLVKTAMSASDPNWGRILAAVGKLDDPQLELSNVSLSINGTEVWEKGGLAINYTEQSGQRALAPEEIIIDINLGLGTSSKTVWTTDLTQEYVRINADYRS